MEVTDQSLVLSAMKSKLIYILGLSQTRIQRGLTGLCQRLSLKLPRGTSHKNRLDLLVQQFEVFFAKSFCSSQHARKKKLYQSENWAVSCQFNQYINGCILWNQLVLPNMKLEWVPPKPAVLQEQLAPSGGNLASNI